jgi:hypothetical protein
MAKRLLIGMTVVCLLSLVGFAQEAPTAVQPGSAGFTSPQLTVLQEAITRLQAALNNGNYGSMKQVGVGGWTSAKFAAYTAGSLERLGHTVSIVSQQTATETKSWVMVRVDVGGAFAWIPVEPLPNVASYQADLGDIPLVSTLVYDSSYLTYDTVVELPDNIAPQAVIRVPPLDVVEGKSSAWFANASIDPDGEIVLYSWTFGIDVQRATHTISQWYNFQTGGLEYPVALTVTDSRGAQASATASVYVLTLAEDEAKKCGCGG